VSGERLVAFSPGEPLPIFLKGRPWMKSQKVRRLTLSRETIQRLDDPSFDGLAGEVSSQCSFVCCPVDTVTCPTG
jgi:hypothetical protein